MLTDTAAGKKLKLWCGDYASRRSRWEDSISNFLGSFGYYKVYTPYIYQKSLHEAFLKWPNEQYSILKSIPHFSTMKEDEDNDKEKLDSCHDNFYLGHKGLNHVLIMKQGQVSYNDLPIKLFEISEIYSSDGYVTNDLGLYVSVACEPETMYDWCPEVFSLTQKSGLEDFRLLTYSLKYGLCSDGLVEYTGKDGQKHTASLILARASYGAKYR